MRMQGMNKITDEMVAAGLAAKVTDYRAEEGSEEVLTVQRAMRIYGFHHPIDGGEMVRAILEAGLAATGNPAVSETEAYRQGFRDGENRTCTVAATGKQQVGEVQGANGKLVAWWNGITPGYDGQGDWSIRWGADAENSRHDIPLYDGFNPIHYQQPAQGIDLWQFRRVVLAAIDKFSGMPADASAAAKLRDLLALIDQRDAAPGVGNG